MAFGEKLQEVRKQSGMTQETFAEQLHVSRQAVSRWESGRGYPEIEKILYICHRYHTTLDALFADELPPIVDSLRFSFMGSMRMSMKSEAPVPLNRVCEKPKIVLSL